MDLQRCGYRDSNDESTPLPDELVLRSDETSRFVPRYLL